MIESNRDPRRWRDAATLLLASGARRFRRLGRAGRRSIGARSGRLPVRAVRPLRPRPLRPAVREGEAEPDVERADQRRGWNELPPCGNTPRRRQPQRLHHVPPVSPRGRVMLDRRLHRLGRRQRQRQLLLQPVLPRAVPRPSRNVALDGSVRGGREKRAGCNCMRRLRRRRHASEQWHLHQSPFATAGRVVRDHLRRFDVLPADRADLPTRVSAGDADSARVHRCSAVRSRRRSSPRRSRPLGAVGTWSLQLSYPGDANNSPTTTPCGGCLLLRSSSKRSASLALVLSPRSVTVGQPVTAGAFVAGYQPTGTLTIRFFAPSDPSCSAAVAIETVPVAGSAPTTTSFVPTSVGSWHVTSGVLWRRHRTRRRRRPVAQRSFLAQKATPVLVRDRGSRPRGGRRQNPRQGRCRFRLSANGPRVVLALPTERFVVLGCADLRRGGRADGNGRDDVRRLRGCEARRRNVELDGVLCRRREQRARCVDVRAGAGRGREEDQEGEVAAPSRGRSNPPAPAGSRSLRRAGEGCIR